MNKLKGFTLPEIMITLALTGIFLVLCQSVYGIFRKMQQRHVTRLEYVSEVALGFHQIRKDMAQAQGFQFVRKDKVEFYGKHQTLNCQYQLVNGLLIRIMDDNVDSMAFAGTWKGDRYGIELIDTLRQITFYVKLPIRSLAKPVLFQDNF